MQKQEVLETLEALDKGQLRVAEQSSTGEWITNTHAKLAILEYFKIQNIFSIKAGDLEFQDKIPIKKITPEMGIRVVPPAIIRYGSFVSKGAILMPSFVNIGAFVGAGSMVDTWATVGSCAQVGKNVHLSGGVGLGGVLEPIQANPVIIEDNAFIGSRAILVEGVIVEQGAVIGAGVTITASTKIIDVTGSVSHTYQGRVPSYSVVIPGSYSKKFAAGEFGVNCALIIGKRKASTDLKTSLNEALRDYDVSV